MQEPGTAPPTFVFTVRVDTTTSTEPAPRSVELRHVLWVPPELRARVERALRERA